MFGHEIALKDGTVQRGLPIAMAIVGLGLMGLETVFVAPASAPLSDALFRGWPLGLESILTQALLVGVAVLVVAAGLIQGSRIASAVALVIGLAPVVVWLHLLTTADPMAFEPYAIRLVATSLLVLTGVTLAWSAGSGVSDGPEPSSRAGPG